MNPYAVRAMIKDPETFVGRESELGDLFTLLAALQSCSIVGPRRIGKSSLLYYLSHPAVYAQHLPDPENYIFAFLDLQELAGLGAEDFFFTAVERLKRAGDRLEVNLDRDGTQSGFRRFLARTGDSGLKLVLCLDEFEMLSQNQRFDADFFTYLRGLCSNYALALVTSSRTSLFDLCHQGDIQTSQFWNIFVERSLGLMPEDEATILAREPFMRAGGETSADETAFVLKLAGRHPFFIQTACYHLFEAKAADAQPELQVVESRFLEEAQRHYAYAWDQLNEDEKTAMAEIFRSPGTPLAPQAFQQLKRQALLVGDPDTPELVSKGWREFLRSKIPSVPSGERAPLEQAARVRGLQSTPELVHVRRDEKARHVEEIEYLDFDLLFEESSVGYRARILNCPADTRPAVDFNIPFSDMELDNFFLRVGRGRRATRRVESSEMEAAKSFGGRLYESIFKDDLQRCLQRSLDEVKRRGAGLRIRLRLTETPGLVDLPWEYLYNTDINLFYSLSTESPIVRYLELPERIRPMSVQPPLRILTMISSPSDYPPLDVEQEWKKLGDSLQGLEREGLMVVDRLEKATLGALLRQLRREEYHIFHFIGHGDYDAQAQDGILILEDNRGRGNPVSGQDLGTILHDEHTLHLVMLNACEGARGSRIDPFAGSAQSLVQQGIPAVVAMQFEITNEAAIVLAHEFYAALADGYPLDAALTEARKAVFAEGNDVEWGTPVLYLRSPDGKIFDFGKKANE